MVVSRIVVCVSFCCVTAHCCVCTVAQMYHRLSALIRKMVQRNKLPGVTYVLVQPRFKNRQGPDYYEQGEFFDFPRLASAYDEFETIEYGQFLDEVKGGKPEVDRGLFIRSSHTGRDDKDMDLATECPGEDEKMGAGFYLYKPDLSAAMIGGVQLGFKEKLTCIHSALMYADHDRLSAIIEAKIGPVQSLLIGGAESILPSYSQAQTVFWHERKHIHYAVPLVTLAREFMGKHDLVEDKFIGVHMRRGDFKTAHAKTMNSDERYAEVLFGLGRTHGTFSFFFATDEKRSLGNIKQLVQAKVSAAADDDAVCAGGRCPRVAVVTFNPGDGHEGAKGAVSSMQAAMVEQVIASKSGYFLGTLHSTFSMEIHFERLSSGVVWGSLLKPEGGRDGCLAGEGSVWPLCAKDEPGGSGDCEAWW